MRLLTERLEPLDVVRLSVEVELCKQPRTDFIEHRHDDGDIATDLKLLLRERE